MSVASFCNPISRGRYSVLYQKQNPLFGPYSDKAPLFFRLSSQTQLSVDNGSCLQKIFSITVQYSLKLGTDLPHSNKAQLPTPQESSS